MRNFAAAAAAKEGDGEGVGYEEGCYGGTHTWLPLGLTLLNMNQVGAADR